MKRSLIFLSTLVLVSGCMRKQDATGDSLVSLHIIDQNGFSEAIHSKDRVAHYENIDFLSPQPYQKVMRVYGKNESGQARSYITSYYPNGELRQYLEVVNNRAFGKYQEWHSNGVLKIEAEINGGEADLGSIPEKSWVFNGISRAYDNSSHLLAEIPYFKGDLEGISRYYYPNGAISKVVPYHNNKIEGELLIYCEGGDLVEKASYCRGKKEGLTTTYWNSNQIKSQENYLQDKLYCGSYYSKSGELRAHITDGNGFRAIFEGEKLAQLDEYKNGNQEGLVQVFGKDEDLIKQYSLRDGLKEGEEIIYVNSKRKLSLHWSQGCIQGLVKTWYDDGSLESQKEMSNNKKNGTFTAWYRNGQLMFVEEYNQDLLVSGEYYKMGSLTPTSRISSGKGIATLYDHEGTFLRKVNYSDGKVVF